MDDLAEIVGAAVGAQSANSAASAPLRANNPGALMPGGKMARYTSPEEGIAALDGNLQRYAKSGVNTLAGVISKWAPPNENDTASYIADVSKRIGVDPNQPIDLANPVVRHVVGAGIMLHENGPKAVFGAAPVAKQTQAPQPAVAPSQEPFGDVADVIGSALTQPQAPQQTPAQPSLTKPQQPASQAAAPGKLESIAAGAGKAFGSSVLAVQQLLGKGISYVGDAVHERTLSDTVAPQKNVLQSVGEWLSNDAQQGAKKLDAENAPYTEAHPGMNVAGQVVGMVASPVNKLIPGAGTASTLTGAVVKGAAQGAALNALSTPVTDDSKPFLLQKAGQAATGAVGGAVGGGFGYGLSAAINKGISGLRSLGNRVMNGNPAEAADDLVGKALQSQGVDPATMPAGLVDGIKDQVRDALAAGKPVDPKAVARLTQAQTLPVPVPMLKGQITRDAMQFAKEQNLRGIQGVGEPITATLQAQNKALIQNLDAIGANAAPDVVTAGKTAIEALSAADAKAQQGVRAAYDAFRNSTGKELDVPLQGLAQDYASAVKTYGDQIPGAIRKQFESLGLMSGTAKKTFSIDDAESLIKDINANYDPMNKPAANALDALRKAVQKSIYEGAGESADGTAAAGLAKAARDAAKARFGLIDSTPALKDTLRGVEPDKFVQKYVLQGNEGQIKNMMSVLSAQDPQAAKALQDSVMGVIKSRVLNNGTSENGVFSQAQLKQFVQDPNTAARLTQVLGPDRMAQLKQLNQVAENALFAPKAAAVNTSNTTSAAANLIKNSVQGGTANRLYDFAKGVPILETPANVLQAGHQARRASALIDEAVNPSLASTAGATPIADLTSLGARGTAAYVGQKRPKRAQQ